MKASELMIGDWVEMNLTPSVHKSYFKAQIVVSNLVSLENNYDFDAKPIPLTEEMLKVNEFEYRGFTGYESMHYDHSVTVYLNKDREIFMLIGGEQRWMRYVHELQHSLRLCGLNELADNFKIE